MSVNVGRVAAMPSRPDLRSGIDKIPQPGRVAVGLEGLSGDEQGNRTVHGGPDKAVYLYAETDYRYWESVLGRPLAPGTFGENLTVSAPDGAALRVGQRLSVGTCVLEATIPREPCATLGVRMDDPAFPKAFLAEGRTGVYTRVITTGLLWAGCAIEIGPALAGDNPTIAEIHTAYATRDRDPGVLARMIAAPELPEDWRAWAQEKVGQG
jgi:MOSC domain-containing protein YiiM